MKKHPNRWWIFWLSVSVLLNVVLYAAWCSQLDTSEEIPVVGTYSTKFNTTYVILDQSGRYCMYQPLQDASQIEVGSYAPVDEHRITPSPDSPSPQSLCTMLIFDGVMYAIAGDGSVCELSHIADFPYYNSVPDVLGGYDQ